MSRSEVEMVRGGGTVWRLPFNPVDEAVHVLNSEPEPWSVQLEARVSKPLDESRLRDAVGQALARHPLARARKAPSRASDHQFLWEITEAPEIDPVRVIDCPDDAGLEQARAELQSLGVPLAESPPLRIRLARHPEGDVLMLNVNHAASDGFGAMRILRSIARAYAGEDDPLPDLDLEKARDLEGFLGSPDARSKAARLATLADKARDLVSAPARLAQDGASERPGYGFRHVILDEKTTKGLVNLDHPGTVNDLLLAALHLAIAGWNADHDAPCGRIGVMVPVNLRPKEWREEVVGNFILPVRVSTTEAERATPAAALEAMTGQTKHFKEAGTSASLIEVLGGAGSLPQWAKQSTSPLLRLTGDRLVDTTILSNLGDLPPLSFGDGGVAAEMWFSAPARMPLGLSVGALSVADRLHLAFRYRHPQFGPDAARRFVERYLGTLELYVKGAA